MNGHVFAEGSNTTAEDRSKAAREYFQGLFGQVDGLTYDLSKSVDTTLHIFSEEFGVLHGDRPVANATVSENSQPADFWEDAQSALLTGAEEADVMVILLSTDTFERTAGEIWPSLIEKAKPDSIWCIGAARSTLDSLDLEKLEQKGCSVITYQRKGVARLGTDTREELLKEVSRKISK